MHQCSKNAKLGKIVELGGEATCHLCKGDWFIQAFRFVVPFCEVPSLDINNIGLIMIVSGHSMFAIDSRSQ